MVEMPPSPALRCSPGQELRGETHKRGRSLENGLLFKEKDDDLALFNEMQLKERESYLLQSTDEFEDSFSTKLRYVSGIKLGISIPVQAESSDLLNADGEKNDYDWLLTPPDTPLFPSLDDEPSSVNLSQRGRPRSQPIPFSRSSTMDKSYKSSRGSASPQRSSPSPRSSNNAFPLRGRPFSAPHSTQTPTLRHATPSQRPSPPPKKILTPAPRSSTPTPRRMRTGSSSTLVSSGVRGASLVKASCGNSASPEIRAWQSSIPGFSSDAPPNLRTSLADRPASYVRGSSPASRHSRDSSSNFGRQSISPTVSRSISSSYSHDRDQLSFHSKGSVASSGDDDTDSLQSIRGGCTDGLASRRAGAFPKNKAPAFSKRPSRTLSSSSAPKRSFDSALRQMDHRKSPQDMFRPLLSSVPSTTFYAGNATSAHRTMISRNSSVTTSSNASSDQATSFAPDTEVCDQNNDDVTSAFGNVPSHEVQDEVFIFDTVDVVDEDIGQETIIRHSKIDEGGFTIQCGPMDSQYFCHHGTAMAVGATSEAVSSKDVICSKCGYRYPPVEPVEEDAKLCADCSRKYGLSKITIPVTTAVCHSSTHMLMNFSEEFKPIRDLEPVMSLSKASEVADTGEIQHEKIDKQGKISYLDQCESYLLVNSLSGSLAEESDDRPVDQRVMSQLRADFSLAHGDVGVQQLEQDHSNSKVDVSAGTGISVLLLNRSSSIKGNVVQGRTFTATSIPCEDPSYARDSTNSFRISASSSADLKSSRQAEARQLSGRKYDMENFKNDMNTKLQSSGSSFSGISNPAYRSLGLARSYEDNFDTSFSNVEYGDEETSFASLEQIPASDDIEVENANQSFTRTSVLQENNFECNGSCQTVNSVALEVSSHALHVRSEDNSVASCPNYEDSVSYENGEDFSKFSNSILDVEASVMSPNSSFKENSLLNASLEGSEVAEVPIQSSLITTSEIEIEIGHQNTLAPQIDVSSNLKSNMDVFQETSFPPPDKDLSASVPEPSSSDHAHGILEESTVMVEGQGVSKGRSLTLEEATDAILFCSSIVQNLAYQAVAIAIDKENSIPVEVSRPAVALLGKSSTDGKDVRSRTGGKHSLRSKKPRQKRMETDSRTFSSKTENDENAGVSFTQNTGLPNKVDSTKPPKLESKCNCTIM